MFKNITLIDLVHTIDKNAPTWDGSCGFSMRNRIDYDDGLRAQDFTMQASVGTHIDVPANFIPGTQDVASLSLDTLFAPACVIDVSDRADADYRVSLDDVRAYEKVYGTIPPKSVVFAYTGWSRFWGDQKRYANVDEYGVMHFPGFAPEVAEFLLTREIVGIGIDAFTPDGSDQSFPVHHILLPAGKYILENVAHLDQLPPVGAYVLVMPLKIAGATESPIRLIGLIQG